MAPSRRLQGVNCVYYELKSGILDKYDNLRREGSNTLGKNGDTKKDGA
jgi:hypothetical protein